MAGRWRRWPAEEKVNSSISHLPDDIIRRIFSFLPFKDLVKTSVLSKQWRLAWTSTPRFNISVPSADIVPFISRALSLCTATKVDKFHIQVCTADFSIRPEVERWVHFAAAHEVEDASLDFGPWYRYYAPPILCNCTSSLVSLRVSNCLFDSRVTIHWPSLENLCLPDVHLNTRELTTILSGCPVLESLKLSAHSTLRIDSTSLRELVIEAVNVSSLDISAPNLLSLRLLGRFFSGLRLNGASSLAEAELTFSKPSECSYHLWQYADRVKVLLEQLRHVAKITIRSWCLEVLSCAKIWKVLYPSLRWRNIIVYATVCKRQLLGIACLLRSSPLLERLVICNPKSNKLMFKSKDFPKLRDFDEEQFWRSDPVNCAPLHLEFSSVISETEGFSNVISETEIDHEISDLLGFDEKQFWHSQQFYCVANHLKRVEIVGFQFDNEQSELLLDLAKFLLEEAVGLEKMIIDVELRMSHRQVATNPHDLWGFHQLVRLQKGRHTVSRSSEIIVNYHFNGLPYNLCKHKHYRQAMRILSRFPKEVWGSKVSLANVNGVRKMFWRVLEKCNYTSKLM